MSKQKGPKKPHKRGEKAAPAAADLGQFMVDMVSSVTQNAMQLATKGGTASARLARVLMLDKSAREDIKPEALEMLAETGAAIKDARRLAGLTIEELGAALDLKDRSVLEAVEAGTATLSFDLILRLASLVARHDPLPFVMKLARVYNPQAWAVLDKWGAGRASVQFERERRFVNLYRRHDKVRDLTDTQFDRLLAFTDQAFELALVFHEQAVADSAPAPKAGRKTKSKAKAKTTRRPKD